MKARSVRSSWIRGPLPPRGLYTDEGQSSALREQSGGGRKSRVSERRPDFLDSDGWILPDFLCASDLRSFFLAFPSLLLGRSRLLHSRCQGPSWRFPDSALYPLQCSPTARNGLARPHVENLRAVNPGNPVLDAGTGRLLTYRFFPSGK